MRKIFVFVFVVFQGVVCNSVYASMINTGVKAEARVVSMDTIQNSEGVTLNSVLGSTANLKANNVTVVHNHITNIYNEDSDYDVYVCRALSKKVLYKWHTNTLGTKDAGKRGLDYVKLNSSLCKYKDDIYVKERLNKAVKKFSNRTENAIEAR